MAESKTNAMRILDSEKIQYSTYSYDKKGEVDGISVAAKIGKPVDVVFKTLVTQGASKNYFVFIIPVAKELDLKAAARAVSEKYVEMIKVSEITKVTGYVRGGCSPLGMKKTFLTVFEESSMEKDAIIVSAGKIGQQVEVNPKDLLDLIEGKIAAICK